MVGTKLDFDWTLLNNVLNQHHGVLNQATLREFAEQHGLNFYSVRSAYYRLKKVWEEQPPEQQVIEIKEEPKEEVKEEVQEEPAPEDTFIIDLMTEHNISFKTKLQMEQIEEFRSVAKDDLIEYAAERSSGRSVPYMVSVLTDWVRIKSYRKLIDHPEGRKKFKEARQEAKELDDVVLQQYKVDKDGVVFPSKMSKPFSEYKAGTLVEVLVVRVESYGALVETTDGHKTPGLIHISNMRDHFVADTNKWFKVGQVLNAQVCHFKPIDSRLSLSTRNVPLVEHGVRTDAAMERWSSAPQDAIPLPDTDFAKQLAALKEKIVEQTEEVAAAQEEKGEDAMNTEWTQAKTFIEAITGTLSSEAEVELQKIMKDTGAFSFAMKLMEQKAKFKPDLGLLLARELTEKQVSL